MKKENEFKEELIRRAIELGAFKAGILSSDDIVTDASFRDCCVQNSCGMYGKCWTCPPDAGDIEKLIADLHSYRYMLLFQTVGNLEDSFDFEGMQECAKTHNELIQKLRKVFAEENITDSMCLGAGGCQVCPVCSKRTGEPCRHPELAVSSLEAYGVFVSKTAEKAGMKYINGQNTVTYFGAVLFTI